MQAFNFYEISWTRLVSQSLLLAIINVEFYPVKKINGVLMDTIQKGDTTP